VTALMVLVGLPAIGLKGKCRRLLKFPEEPARWEPPGVPDDRAGVWPAAVVSALLTVFLSLTEDFVEDRMSLAEVLQRLRLALADEGISMRFESDQSGGDAAPAQGGGGESIAPPESEEERCCVVCWRNPREVRFGCGHASLCRSCYAALRMRPIEAQLCPNCRAPIGETVAELGAHVNAAPTFVMGRAGRRQSIASSSSSTGRGRGGRGGHEG